MAMTEVSTTNSRKPVPQPPQPELPPDRKAAVQFGLEQFQRIATERDELLNECAKLRTDLAAQKVVAEALQSQVTDMESRVTSAYAVRDAAVKREAKLETVLESIMAMGRTFEIASAPMIKAEPEADE